MPESPQTRLKLRIKESNDDDICRRTARTRAKRGRQLSPEGVRIRRLKPISKKI